MCFLFEREKGFEKKTRVTATPKGLFKNIMTSPTKRKGIRTSTSRPINVIPTNTTTIGNKNKRNDNINKDKDEGNDAYE